MLLWMVVACSPKDEGKGPDPTTESEGSSPTTDTTPPDTGADTGAPAPDCAEARIGAAGGELALYGVQLELPEGALAGDTDLTLCVADPPGGVVPVSDVIEVGPPTMELLVAGILTVNHTGDLLTTGLFVPDPTGAPVRQVRQTRGEQSISGPLYRPGVVFAAEDARALVPYLNAGVADVLFVIDNTCSMADEQDQLAADMDVILQELVSVGADFHAGVVTTDVDDPTDTFGELREVDGLKWVEPTTPNPGQVFGAMVTAGVSGGSEKGLGAAYSRSR